MTSRRLAAAALVLIGLSGAACDSESYTQALPPDALLEVEVRQNAAAMLAGDVQAAHARLTSRCRALVDPQAVPGGFAGYPDARFRDIRIDELVGDRAVVSYRFSEAALDVDREPWRFEDGEWRRDRCGAKP